MARETQPGHERAARCRSPSTQTATTGLMMNVARGLARVHIAAGVVVQDDAGLFLLAFRDRRVAEQDAENVNAQICQLRPSEPDVLSPEEKKRLKRSKRKSRAK